MSKVLAVLKTVESLIDAVMDASDHTVRFSVSTPSQKAERVHRLRLLLNLELQELAKGPDPDDPDVSESHTRPRRR